MQSYNGSKYTPQGKPQPVVSKGEFYFAVVGIDHPHFYAMCDGLIVAGATLKWVYDPDPVKIKKFREVFPDVKVARAEQEVLQDPEVRLVMTDAIPSDRAALGIRVMDHGKDFFSDKAAFTTLGQLELAKAKVAETGRKHAVYYGERIHVESAVFAGQLIKDGAIGRVVQVINLAPHKLHLYGERPKWWFEKKKTGGIIVDIGSHQIDQFLFYAGCKDAKVLNSKVANYRFKQYEELEDFGDVTLLGDNGATGYFRVDWLTPSGLGDVESGGDGRCFILGTEGYIELRKYTDIVRDKQRDHLYLVNQEGQYHLELYGKVGYPYFGELILDCLNKTENAMTQEHAFKVSELSLIAQMQAVRVE